MDDLRPIRSLRVFLLAWEGLVYLWGLLSLCVDPALLQQVYDGQLCKQGAAGQSPCLAVLSFVHVSPVPVGAFTGLMLVHGALLWLGLSRVVPRRIHLPYFLVQGALVLALSLLVARATNVTLSLSLILTLGAIDMLTGARRLAIVAGGAIVLFVASSMWAWGAWSDASFWLRLWLKSDYVVLVLFAIGYLLLYVQQVRLHGRLSVAHAALRASATRIEELTVLAERQRMARELHDTLAQGLTGVLMQLQAASARLRGGRYERAQEAVQQAMAEARTALATARSAIDDLRVVELTAAELPQAAHTAVERFSAATGIVCAVDLAALAAVPVPLHHHVLRAIGEGVANVARHAQATHVWIEAAHCDGAITVAVRDDGIGFAPEVVAGQGGHYGLLGLRERARLAGGQLEIRSAPGAGTTIRLSIPNRVEDQETAPAEQGPHNARSRP